MIQVTLIKTLSKGGRIMKAVAQFEKVSYEQWCKDTGMNTPFNSDVIDLAIVSDHLTG